MKFKDWFKTVRIFRASDTGVIAVDMQIGDCFYSEEIVITDLSKAYKVAYAKDDVAVKIVLWNLLTRLESHCTIIRRYLAKLEKRTNGK